MIASIGATCFGVVIGYVTYRTLVRKDDSSISDIASVVAAVGGGVVTQLFGPASADRFGWYAIGLLCGMAVFLVLRIVLERPSTPGEKRPEVLGDEKPARSAGEVILGDSSAGGSQSAILGD
ncbi:MAG TPA: hypothetical protein VIJ07_00160 [Dermatophilaceae bacterium]